MVLFLLCGLTLITCGPKCPNNNYCEGQWEWYGTGENITGSFRGLTCQDSSCKVYSYSIDNTKVGSAKCNCD